ncbi:MAG TPA: 1-acyl-sn-glycerol-3-phosphate acyltransferase, partial [Pyrinomonadaceae bacterium]|nr:1-acyl-sn-glycerol-3-phosphate acyltransferase [Pyrinomonadaceae bacterium]
MTEPRRRAFRDYAFSALAIPLIYLYTAVMGTLSLAVSFFDTPRGEKQHRCAQIWSRLIARTVCSRIEVTGLSRLAPGASYVFLSTHQSYMDIPVMLGYLPVQLRIAAKKEVFRVPLLGGHL